MSFARDVLFVALLAAAFARDVRTMEIPHRLTAFAMAAAVVTNVLVGMNPWSLAAGAGAIGGFFWLQYALSRGAWIGGGDVMLGTAIGLMLGFERGLAAVALAYAVGGVAALWLVASGRATGQTRVPFGAFLAPAAAATLLWGDAIVGWYVGLF